MGGSKADLSFVEDRLLHSTASKAIIPDCMSDRPALLDGDGCAKLGPSRIVGVRLEIKWLMGRILSEFPRPHPVNAFIVNCGNSPASTLEARCLG